MVSFWLGRRVPNERIFLPEAWLGTDAQAQIDRGEYEDVRRRLMRWQKRVGAPGDPVSKRLLKLTREGGVDLEQVRGRLAKTLVAVERAYLLNTKLPLSWSTEWVDGGFFWRYTYPAVLFAARQARRQGLPFKHDGTYPARLVPGVNYGYPGTAWFRTSGYADELQKFVDTVFWQHTMGGISKRTVSSEGMREIPTYERAAQAGREAFVQVPIDALHEGRGGLDEVRRGLRPGRRPGLGPSGGTREVA
jgi:hypothetical protein